MPNLQAILTGILAVVGVVAPAATVFWTLAERDERIREELRDDIFRAIERINEADRATRDALRAEDQKATERRQALENEIKLLIAKIAKLEATLEERRIMVDRLVEREFNK